MRQRLTRETFSMDPSSVRTNKYTVSKRVFPWWYRANAAKRSLELFYAATRRSCRATWLFLATMATKLPSSLQQPWRHQCSYKQAASLRSPKPSPPSTSPPTFLPSPAVIRSAAALWCLLPVTVIMYSVYSTLSFRSQWSCIAASHEKAQQEYEMRSTSRRCDAFLDHTEL